MNKISPLCINTIAFLNELSSNREVRKMIVFGSRAFGDYKQFSDLDLAVDVGLMSNLDWLKLKDYAINDLSIFINISLVNFGTNPLRLQEHILKTGIIIYEW